MKKACLTQAQLTAGLKRLGVQPGDVLMVHSSLKSLGPVEGGAGTLIAALEAALTQRGTLVMPAFAYVFERINAPVEPYDPNTSPSRVGLVSETFRRSPGVLRGRQPTHSLAAWGAPGPRSFSQRTIRRACSDRCTGRLSSTLRSCSSAAASKRLTLLHVAEELAEMPYLAIANWGHLGWKATALTKDEHGRPQSCVCLTCRAVAGISAPRWLWPTSMGCSAGDDWARGHNPAGRRGDAGRGGQPPPRRARFPALPGGAMSRLRPAASGLQAPAE